uniref:hypothetical protein n=1 Tax=Anaerococcus lactolyticus TaxID=33032 RepID=UPI002889EAB5
HLLKAEEILTKKATTMSCLFCIKSFLIFREIKKATDVANLNGRTKTRLLRKLLRARENRLLCKLFVLPHCFFSLNIQNQWMFKCASFRLNTPNQGVFNGERIRTFEPHLLKAEEILTKKATTMSC